MQDKLSFTTTVLQCGLYLFYSMLVNYNDQFSEAEKIMVSFTFFGLAIGTWFPWIDALLSKALNWMENYFKHLSEGK